MSAAAAGSVGRELSHGSNAARARSVYIRLRSAFFVRPGNRREQPEIDVHRLVRLRLRRAGDMRQQRAQRGRPPAGAPSVSPGQFGRGEAPARAGRSPRSRYSPRTPVICPAKRRLGRPMLQPQRGVEQFGGTEEGVAVQAAQPRELGVLPARGWCGTAAPARHASAWSGSRRCSTACRGRLSWRSLHRRHRASARCADRRGPTRLHRAEAQRIDPTRSAITSIGMQPSK